MADPPKCESCRRPIEPPDVALEALEQEDVTGFNPPHGTTEYADGRVVHFHESCYPHGSRWFRMKPPDLG